MSVTVRQASSFHILTSCAQVDADIREDIISLLLLGNDVASAEALAADIDNVTLKSCSIYEMFVLTTFQGITDIIPSNLHQDHPLAEMSEIWSIKAMIRNWVGFESPKQLMMACMLLLEVARRCPESRKKLTTL